MVVFVVDVVVVGVVVVVVVDVVVVESCSKLNKFLSVKIHLLFLEEIDFAISLGRMCFNAQ